MYQKILLKEKIRMFVCDDCLNKKNIFAVPISLGKCELCNEMGVCADIDKNLLPRIKKNYRMYFFVKSNIGMRKGKTAGQVGHAAARLARELTQRQWEDYLEYEVKYVYAVKEFPDIKEEYQTIVHIVVDQGKTQIAPETETVMGVFTDQDLNPHRIYKLMS